MLFSSVQFSYSVVADSLRHHGLQHTSLPCPSPTPGTQIHVHPVGDAIQPSHPLLSPSPPSISSASIFPSIIVFSNGQCFASGGQNIGVSASASVLPMNIQD